MTLIALVITIIVLLILAIVTVNVVMNGGLFNEAQSARNRTDSAVDREKLDSAVVSAYDPITGIVNTEKLNEELQKLDFPTVSGNAPWTVISKKGNEFIIEENGEILNEEIIGGQERDNNNTVNQYGFYENKAYVSETNNEDIGPYCIIISNINNNTNKGVFNRYRYNESTQLYEVEERHKNIECSIIDKDTIEINWREILGNDNIENLLGQYVIGGLIYGEENLLAVFSIDGTICNLTYNLDLNFDMSQLSE